MHSSSWSSLLQYSLKESNLLSAQLRRQRICPHRYGCSSALSSSASQSELSRINEAFKRSSANDWLSSLWYVLSEDFRNCLTTVLSESTSRFFSWTNLTMSVAICFRLWVASMEYCILSIRWLLLSFKSILREARTQSSRFFIHDLWAFLSKYQAIASLSSFLVFIIGNARRNSSMA